MLTLIFVLFVIFFNYICNLSIDTLAIILTICIASDLNSLSGGRRK